MGLPLVNYLKIRSNKSQFLDIIWTTCFFFFLPISDLHHTKVKIKNLLEILKKTSLCDTFLRYARSRIQWKSMCRKVPSCCSVCRFHGLPWENSRYQNHKVSLFGANGRAFSWVWSEVNIPGQGPTRSLQLGIEIWIKWTETWGKAITEY